MLQPEKLDQPCVVERPTHIERSAQAAVAPEIYADGGQPDVPIGFVARHDFLAGLLASTVQQARLEWICAWPSLRCVYAAKSSTTGHAAR